MTRHALSRRPPARLGVEPRLGSAIVPALHDVQWDTVKVGAGAAGHEIMLADK
jgi:hypothetical protein